MKRTILFDLDGTITESAPGIVNSVAYALKKMGKQIEDRESLKQFVGPPLKDSMKKYYAMNDEQASQAIVYYREYYAEKGIFENSVYDGFLQSAKRLCDAGYRLAIATSKPEVYAKKIAKKFEFAEYFFGIYGASMDTTRIRKGDVIAYALSSMRITEDERKNIWMVGDRKYDIIGAKENGLKSMGVLYGYGDRAELEAAGADYIAETTTEIADIILS